MRKLFYILFDGCNHFWETKDEGNIVFSDKKDIIGGYKSCRCSKCGKWKIFNLIAKF